MSAWCTRYRRIRRTSSVCDDLCKALAKLLSSKRVSARNRDRVGGTYPKCTRIIEIDDGSFGEYTLRRGESDEEEKLRWSTYESMDRTDETGQTMLSGLVRVCQWRKSVYVPQEERSGRTIEKSLPIQQEYVEPNDHEMQSIQPRLDLCTPISARESSLD
jgi:hypothetical protein